MKELVKTPKQSVNTDWGPGERSNLMSVQEESHINDLVMVGADNSYDNSGYQGYGGKKAKKRAATLTQDTFKA